MPDVTSTLYEEHGCDFGYEHICIVRYTARMTARFGRARGGSRGRAIRGGGRIFLGLMVIMGKRREVRPSRISARILQVEELGLG